MDAQKKSRESTDAHRHRSKLWWLDAEMLSVLPGERVWWHRSFQVPAAPITAHCKTNTEHYFDFLPFLHKSKNSLQISFGY